MQSSNAATRASTAICFSRINFAASASSFSLASRSSEALIEPTTELIYFLIFFGGFGLNQVNQLARSTSISTGLN
jgi:hypothetical protein